VLKRENVHKLILKFYEREKRLFLNEKIPVRKVNFFERVYSNKVLRKLLKRLVKTIKLAETSDIYKKELALVF
jgi:hypothetical protein